MSKRVWANRGYSLIELMVALVLALIITGALVLVYLGQKASYVSQDSFARTQENGRYAVALLVNDLRMAGFWGGYNGAASNILGAVSPTTSGCNTSSWAQMVEHRIFGLNDTINDTTPTGDYTACIDATKNPRGDVLVVRRTAASPLTVGALKANHYYLKTDYDTAVLFTGTSVPEGGFAAGYPSYIHPLIAHAYYVRDGSVRCSETGGPPLPSLYRYTVTGQGLASEVELVGPVENFQVQYGVDADGTGTVDQFYDASDLKIGAAPDWRNVIAVRFWLLLRAACPETGFSDNLTYVLPGGDDYTPNDNFRRQLYSTTVMLRNAAN